jgi:hypothetical protein
LRFLVRNGFSSCLASALFINESKLILYHQN